MASKPFCVICKFSKRNNDNVLRPFTPVSLDRCKAILKVRRAHGLQYEDVVLPDSVTKYHCTHKQCYSNFTALMAKYSTKSAEK